MFFEEKFFSFPKLQKLFESVKNSQSYMWLKFRHFRHRFGDIHVLKNDPKSAQNTRDFKLLVLARYSMDSYDFCSVFEEFRFFSKTLLILVFLLLPVQQIWQSMLSKHYPSNHSFSLVTRWILMIFAPFFKVSLFSSKMLSILVFLLLPVQQNDNQCYREIWIAGSALTGTF